MNNLEKKIAQIACVLTEGAASFALASVGVYTGITMLDSLSKYNHELLLPTTITLITIGLPSYFFALLGAELSIHGIRNLYEISQGNHHYRFLTPRLWRRKNNSNSQDNIINPLQ